MNAVILEQQAARVTALRKELKVAERQLAESITIFVSEGHHTCEVSRDVLNAIDWRKAVKAVKRLGLAKAAP